MFVFFSTQHNRQYGQYPLEAKGVAEVVRYFVENGHEVTVYIPNFNKESGGLFEHNRCGDRHFIDILHQLEIAVYPPVMDKFDEEKGGFKRVPNHDDL